jgi:hypothetical protein
MKVENRVSRRRIVCQPAVVLGRNGSIFCECAMMDVSATGAKLVLSAAESPKKIETPDEFELVLSHNGRVRRRCRVSWRSDNAIGIRFIE